MDTVGTGAVVMTGVGGLVDAAMATRTGAGVTTGQPHGAAAVWVAVRGVLQSSTWTPMVVALLRD